MWRHATHHTEAHTAHVGVVLASMSTKSDHTVDRDQSNMHRALRETHGTNETQAPKKRFTGSWAVRSSAQPKDVPLADLTSPLTLEVAHLPTLKKIASKWKGFQRHLDRVTGESSSNAWRTAARKGVAAMRRALAHPQEDNVAPVHESTVQGVTDEGSTLLSVRNNAPLLVHRKLPSKKSAEVCTRSCLFGSQFSACWPEFRPLLVCVAVLVVCVPASHQRARCRMCKQFQLVLLQGLLSRFLVPRCTEE